jgi:KDO2-lipid IV(A) lauroyltransferase
VQAFRKLGSWLGVSLLWLLHLLPNRAVAAVGRGLGSVLYRFGRGRVTRINLALCFPQMSEAERHALGLAHFKALGRALAEQSIFWFAPIERALAMVKITGTEHFDRLRGTPVIVFAPHFIGLNLGGPKIAYAYPGSASIYSRQKNPVLERIFLTARTRFGNPYLVSRQEGLRSIIRVIKSGKPVKILGQPLFYEPVSIAVDKGDPEFAAKIRDIIEAMRADGTLKKISEKRLGVDITAPPPGG